VIRRNSRTAIGPGTRPSRLLLVAAAAALLLFGIAPLLVMARHLWADPSALDTLLTERTLSLLWRTLLLGVGAASVALALGMPFGYLVARTNVFGARALRALGVVPILIPPIMLAMTWTMVTSLRGPLMCAFILGLATMPLVAMFTARAAERIDARREEAALLVGGRGAAVALAFPLVLPSALGAAVLAFIVAVNDFALPDYVSAVGRKFNVYAGEVFSTWQVDGNEARAVATALPLIALTLLALVPMVLARRGDRFGTVEGDFVAPSPLDLGRWRWPATLFCAAVVGAASFLPILRLAYEAGGGPRVFSGVSIRRAAWQQGGGAAQNTPDPNADGPDRDLQANPDLRRATLERSVAAALNAAGLDPDALAPAAVQVPPSRQAALDPNAPELLAALESAQADDLSDEGGGVPLFLSNLRKSFARAMELSRESILASLLIAFLAATMSLPIALVLGHAVRRLRMGAGLEVLSLAPLVVPATLFGIGTIVLWNHGATEALYTSQWLVALLYVGRFLAIPTLILSGAVASFGPRLEESAALAGAGPIRRLFTIVGPGVRSGLVGSWIAVFALSVRELDAAVLVPAANDTAMFRVFNAVHFGRDDFVSALALLVIFSVLLPGLLWSVLARSRPRYLP